MPKIKLGISGPGKSGKDTAAEILRDSTTMRYGVGTSEFAAELVYDMWGNQHYDSAKECWEDRHEHRYEWAHCIDQYNYHDPVKLYRDCLANQDMLTGVRRLHELRAVKKARLVDLWIWIERDVPHDPTQEYGPEECDIIINNNGTVEDLSCKLIALAWTWGILKAVPA